MCRRVAIHPRSSLAPPHQPDVASPDVLRAYAVRTRLRVRRTLRPIRRRLYQEILEAACTTAQVLRDPEMLYIAIGILGATVMPHNLYLHSSIVQTRRVRATPAGQARGGALRVRRLDDRALASRSSSTRRSSSSPPRRSTRRATPRSPRSRTRTSCSRRCSAPGASAAFALALLASGQNSTLTGTLAGQIVMEGFLNIRHPALAAAPDHARDRHCAGRHRRHLLRRKRHREAADPQPGDSQPAALVRRLSARGVHVRSREDGRVRRTRRWLKVLAWSSALVIAGLNAWLLVQTFADGSAEHVQAHPRSRSSTPTYDDAILRARAAAGAASAGRRSC